MTGNDVYEKLKELRVRPSDLAKSMGTIPQNIASIFNSPDVKSGTLEAIADALGRDMTLWYPVTEQNTYNNTGNAGRDINQGVAQQNKELIESVIESNSQLLANNTQLTTTNAQLTQIIANLTRH